MLCFHGFGEQADTFAPLARQLQDDYTIIAIDMPLHGQTRWNEGLLCTAEDIVGILDEIPALRGQKFLLAGFSMGGRVALSIYEQIPERVQKLILIAPDGIKINFWYWLATQTVMGNRLFKYLMKKPGPFFVTAHVLKRLGMINSGIYHYVTQYLRQRDMRNRLYTIWTTLRKIKPSIPVVQSTIRKYRTPAILIYGRYDRIIRYTTGLKFKKRTGEPCALHLLNCGHRVLQEKNATAIAALIR